MDGVVDELVGGLLKPDEKRVVEELFKDGVVEQLLNGASSSADGASSSGVPLIVEELLVISSSMGTKL